MDKYIDKRMNNFIPVTLTLHNYFADIRVPSEEFPKPTTPKQYGVALASKGRRRKR